MNNKKISFKEILALILTLLLVPLVFGLTISVIRNNIKELPPDNSWVIDSPSINDSISVDNSEIDCCSITYFMSNNGIVNDIPDFLFQEDGNYPVEYIVGEEFDVDDLHGAMTQTSLGYVGAFEDPNNSYKDYSFYGWYLDSDCTYSLENTSELSGDIVLYAKVSIGYWTPFY